MSEKNTSKILELVCLASEKPEPALLERIISTLNSLPDGAVSSFLPDIELLLDSWGEAIESSNLMSSFCVSLAELPDLASSSSLRNALILVVRKSAPEFLTKSEAVNLSKVREESFPLRKSLERIKKISNLQNPKLCAYLLNSNEWIEKIGFDPISHFVEVFNFISNRKKNIPLDVFISDSLFFNISSDEVLSKIDKKNILSFNEWKSFLYSNAIIKPDDDQLRILSLNTFVPEKKTSSEFTAWLEEEEKDTDSPFQIRYPHSARSLDELRAIIARFKKENLKISFPMDDAKAISAVIIKSAKVAKNTGKTFCKDISEVLAFLMDLAEDDNSKNNLISAFSILEEIILPQDRETRENLMEAWSGMSLSILKVLLELIKKIKGEDFLATFALDMPLKALSSLQGLIDETKIVFAFNSSRAKAHADIIMWAWKNSKNQSVLKTLIMPENIFSAIAEKTDLKFRNTAIRELKKILLSEDKFISLLAENGLKKSPEELLHLIDDDKILLPSEKQSLIVKLSRVSREFKNTIESAHGSGGIKLSKTLTDNKKGLIQRITSIKSHKAKILELEDIKQRQIPENSAAIAHARSYGDLRENAEYSAAKERQRFLNRRKFEIERDLNNVAAVRFTNNEANEQLIKPGRKVLLKEKKTQKNITYFILGAWDGDPLKNRLSSESALARELIGKSEGEIVSVNGEEFLIEKVSFLPEDMLSELNDE